MLLLSLFINAHANNLEAILMSKIDQKISDVDVILTGQAVACAESLDRLHCSQHYFKKHIGEDVFDHMISYLQLAVYSNHFNIEEKKRINKAHARLIQYNTYKFGAYFELWKNDRRENLSTFKNQKDSLLNNAVVFALNKPLQDEKYINRLSATIACAETLHKRHCFSEETRLFSEGSSKTSDGSKYGVELDILYQASHAPLLNQMPTLKERIAKSIQRLINANTKPNDHAQLDLYAY